MASAILTGRVDRKNCSKFIQNMHTPHEPSVARMSGGREREKNGIRSYEKRFVFFVLSFPTVGDGMNMSHYQQCLSKTIDFNFGF